MIPVCVSSLCCVGGEDRRCGVWCWARLRGRVWGGFPHPSLGFVSFFPGHDGLLKGRVVSKEPSLGLSGIDRLKIFKSRDEDFR